jgi:cobalt/nickel transport system permease protein
MFKVSGKDELPTPAGVHAQLAGIQNKTAFLPDYGFRTKAQEEKAASWPAPSAGTSLSGLVGGGVTLVLVVSAGWLLSAKGRSKTMES